jgi:hypothetical protein
MKTTATLFISSMFFVCYTAIAANPPSSKFVSQFLHPKDWAFEENRGQLTDPSGGALSEIKYFGNFGGAQIYCTNQKLSFVFTKTMRLLATKNPKKTMGIEVPLPPKSTISASRIDLEFEGANTDVSILSSDKQDMTVNYATAHSGENGISGVSFYKTLTYKNLYNYIDMVVSANTTGLEYEFIVHPGGNPKDIMLVRNGADNMEMLTNGGIKYATALGTMEESKPQSFVGNQAVKSNFVRSGNKLSFKTEEYDHTKNLVIDPGLSWSTYFGNDSSSLFFSIAVDASDNVYAAGYTNSISGLASSGAYQTSLEGGANYDVLVVKFSSVGKFLWATYYGGDSSDFADGCAIDKNGNLYVTGYTLSSSGIATKGSYQTASKISYGYYDAFLAKFSTTGGLTWATYYGGNGVDVSRSVATDVNGNPYICGNTTSYSGIASKGGFQTTYGGGVMDGFIAKFSSAGNFDWGTYFGGGGTDYCLGLTVDQTKNIFITGATSSVGSIATKGSFQTIVDPTYGNAFLTLFDTAGAKEWGTYFGGNGGGDYGCSVSVSNSKVYMAGYTGNYSGVATNGSYQSVYGGGNTDAFVAGFNVTGSINWATYYGGNGDDGAYGILSDSSGNIYITGFTSSSNQMATSGAFLTSLAGSYENSFIAKFNSSGTLLYGTYFGGDTYDEAHGIGGDATGDIYIAGFTASTDIATAGAYQTKYEGLNYDFNAFIAKFLFCDLTTSISGPTLTCANSTTSYVASSHPNSNYTWTISGGTIASGNYTDSITVKWNGNGAGTVKEQELNSLTGCNDTKSLNVTIANLPVPAITGDTLVCPLSSSSYHVVPISGVSYTWSVKTGSISSAAGRDSIEVFWVTTGKGAIYINESSAGGACKSGDTVNITIVALPVAKTKINDNGKGYFKLTCQDSSLNSTAYNWIINGSKYDGYSVRVNFAQNGTYHISLTVTNSAGCTSTFDSTITVTDAGISQYNPGNTQWSIFPNPFKDQIEIQYSVTEPGLVEIVLSDMLGRKIATIENKTLQSGNYVCTFDAGKINLTEGIYLITMSANGSIETQRMVRVKD